MTYQLYTNMKSSLNIISSLVLSMGVGMSILFSGCKHDDTMMDPTIQNSFGKFYVQDSLRAKKGAVQMKRSDAVAFGQNEKVTFTAKFSVKTAWVLVIQGAKSKATKTITGNSSFLDATNAQWDGSSDVPTFPPDSAIATLSFPSDNSRKPIVTSFKVSSSKNFAANPNYIVVADFAKPSDTTKIAFNNDPNTAGPGSNCTKVAVKNLAGVWCFDAAGMEDGKTSYYMGGLTLLPSIENPASKYFPIVSPGVVADSELVANTYFNVWVYGYSNPVLKMTVQFNESDKGNTDYVNNPAMDDTWEYVIYPTWTGWKQVSFSMNKTTTSTAALYGGSGNHRREIDRIVSITVNIATDKSATGIGVEETYTYPIFSKGAPFNY
jgi:hypothetical protein